MRARLALVFQKKIMYQDRTSCVFLGPGCHPTVMFSAVVIGKLNLQQENHKFGVIAIKSLLWCHSLFVFLDLDSIKIQCCICVMSVGHLRIPACLPPERRGSDDLRSGS